MRPVTTADKDFVIAFIRSYKAYCVANGININEVCRSVKSKGLANMYPNKINQWACGQIQRPVYVYTLNVLCEEIGLKLMDFVQVTIPAVYVPVRPELLRKKPRK